MSRSKGFTLVELLVVLLIVGIFSAIAIPNFQLVLRRIAADRDKSDLLNLMMLARSEAVKRGLPTAIASSSSNWGGTLTAYVDLNADQILDASEPILSVLAASRSLTLFPGAAVAGGIGFSGTGALLGGNGSVGISQDNPSGFVGLMCFNSTGRTTMVDFSPPKISLPSISPC